MNLDKAMTALAKKDMSFFDLVYNATNRAVFFVALSIVKERALAEDVMQSTYVTVIEKASQYRTGTNAAAWIVTIARNSAINLYNRRKREQSVDVLTKPELFGVTTQNEESMLIELARVALESTDFVVLMLITAQGYKRREVAAILNMPIGTVTWKYQRAVAILRTSWSMRPSLRTCNVICRTISSV